MSGVYVHFSELAAREAEIGRAPVIEEAAPEHRGPISMSGAGVAPDTPAPHDVLPSPNIPSPGPALVFESLSDNGVIPPDTMGAVGPRHVMTTLNGGYRIHAKSTGATISSMAIASFWASTGSSGPFDPKATYDPYNNRWILSAVSNARSSTSSVLLGISETDDPSGGWWLYRFVACSTACGATGIEWWADYPEVGFNNKWVAVTVNMFGTSDGLFKESRMWVVNYPTARTGSAPTTLFTALQDFTIVPTITYSVTEPTLYTVTHVFGSGAAYRLSTITGTVGAPVYTRGAQRTHTLLSGWSEANSFGADRAPQAPEPGTSLERGLDQGDSRILHAVFRNGAIYYTQTVALPAGAPTHTAAQWVRLNTAGGNLDAGRIEDPSATATNGGRWYGFPSIAVNANNDVLIGVAIFGSTIYPSGGYAYRASTDAPGTTRDVVMFAPGADFYYKTYSGTRNRWGDFSGTQVDPSDDRTFWTIQESSRERVGSGNGAGRWTTTWAKVQLDPSIRTRPGDFDGDGRSDITVFRVETSTWYTIASSGGTRERQWGDVGDIPVPGDYDGDGIIDIAVFRPSDGGWFVLQSAGGETETVWGDSADIPVPGDYDGDRLTDWAIFRPSTGTWWVRYAAGGFSAVVWGDAADKPVPGDYDGDGRTDWAIFRPSTGTWWVRQSSGGFTNVVWGVATDVPVPGDYDGDRRTDWAIYRPSTGFWWVRQSSGGGRSVGWGDQYDRPVPGDYDGDGRADIAVFRPGNGTWYVIASSNGAQTATGWGIAEDIPILAR